MIMSGAKEATIHHVQTADIHGTRFYDLAYTHDDAPETVRTTRIGVESVYSNPRPGDRVRVSYVMNVAVSVTARDA